MNIGWLLQPGEDGIDPDWYKKDLDQAIGDEVSFWLSDLTMHTRAASIAADIVRSRQQP